MCTYIQTLMLASQASQPFFLLQIFLQNNLVICPRIQSKNRLSDVQIVEIMKKCIPTHMKPWLLCARGCVGELKKLFRGFFAGVPEAHHFRYKFRAVSDVVFIMGISPHLVSNLQFPLLCTNRNAPSSIYLFSLFLAQARPHSLSNLLSLLLQCSVTVRNGHGHNHYTCLLATTSLHYHLTRLGK